MRLYRGGFDATKTASACGQSVFSNLSKGTVQGGDAYSLDVTMSGFQPKTVTDVDVDGASNITVVLDPI